MAGEAIVVGVESIKENLKDDEPVFHKSGNVIYDMSSRSVAEQEDILWKGYLIENGDNLRQFNGFTIDRISYDLGREDAINLFKAKRDLDIIGRNSKVDEAFKLKEMYDKSRKEYEIERAFVLDGLKERLTDTLVDFFWIVEESIAAESPLESLVNDNLRALPNVSDNEFQYALDNIAKGERFSRKKERESSKYCTVFQSVVKPREKEEVEEKIFKSRFNHKPANTRGTVKYVPSRN